MTQMTASTEPISLWECLHDGGVEAFKSDLTARTLAIVVDSPYHWEFHKLPTATRYSIVGENVRVAEVFESEPWQGATEPIPGTPWKESEEHRQQDYKNGRLISVDWNAFIADVQTDEDYLVMNAELNVDGAISVLSFGIMSYPNSNYRDVKIHAECFHFNVGAREVSLQEFQEFGAAYWEDSSKKSKALSEKTE
jgi:hypothetical protein